MDQDYFSIDSILAGNQVLSSSFLTCLSRSSCPQKIQCVFKQDLPNLGHLGGGSERHARLPVPPYTSILIFSRADRRSFQGPDSYLARIHSHLLVCCTTLPLLSLPMTQPVTGPTSTSPLLSDQGFVTRSRPKLEAFDYPASLELVASGMDSGKQSPICM